MKRIFLLTAMLLLTAVSNGIMAQDATSIIDRYYKISGFNEVDAPGANLKMEMTISTQGMEMPCSIIISPPNRMRMEMTMAGQKMLVVVNGDKGWMSVPGMGTQPIPADQIKQISQQNNPLQSMRWDAEEFDLTLLEPVTQEGVKYDVVKAKAKNANSPVTEQILYFNNATGLVSFSDATISVGGQSMQTKTEFKEYKTIGKFQHPSELEVSMNGNVVSTVKIKSIEFDYPVTDEMFTEP